MSTTDRALCVDWGTSNLRLYLVERSTGKVLARHEGPEGILDTFRAWSERGGDRVDHFRGLLQEAIAQLGRSCDQTLEGLPLVLSGMASSSVGMSELPYGELPQNLADGRLPTAQWPATSDFPHPILLISGLRRPDDVMRGEEVQAIGLFQVWSELPRRLTLILPGTHSKHILLEDRRLVDFRTYMSGELYAVLHLHTILAQSVLPERADVMPNRPAFAEGVRVGSRLPLARALFSLRARQVLGSLDQDDGASYLSGLLLGHELAPLAEATQGPLCLAAGPRLVPAYERAIAELGWSGRTRILSAQAYEQLLIQGQLRLLTSSQHGPRQ